MGDSSKSYLASIKDFSGSVDVLFDETDTNGQTALAVGSSVTLNFAPEGTASGDVKLTGTAIVTGKSINSSFDGLVEASISIQGSGGLTTTTY
jgi:predicted secreted protein